MGLSEKEVWDELAQSGEREISGITSRRESFLRLVQREPERLSSHLDVFGVPVATCRFAELASWFFAAASTRGRFPKVVMFAAARSFQKAWSDAGHAMRLAEADVVLAEGAGVHAYAKLAGVPLPERYDAAVTVDRLLAAAPAERPLRVFLVGADRKTLLDAKVGIEARYANVDVVGLADARPDACLSEEIGESVVDVVLVGIGGGKDELWIDENAELLDVGVVMNVGDALLAYARSEAPPRAQKPLGFREAISFLFRATLYLALPWLRPARAYGPSALNR